MIRLDLPADQRFAQPERGIDHRLAAQTAERVGGEEHARCLALHHMLDDHRQADLAVIDGIARPVADGAGGPQAAPAVDHRLL